MTQFVVSVVHWTDYDSVTEFGGDLYDYVTELDVDAVDEDAAVQSVREEYPQHSWNAWASAS